MSVGITYGVMLFTRKKSRGGRGEREIKGQRGVGLEMMSEVVEYRMFCFQKDATASSLSFCLSEILFIGTCRVGSTVTNNNGQTTNKNKESTGDKLNSSDTRQQ